MFKLVQDKDGTTSFLPIESKTGGKVNYIKNKGAMYLFEKPANYVYKKVEVGKVINVNTMKNEIEQDIDREEDNPYKRVILNKVYKEEDKTPHMEHWSIFSDNVRYVQHDERTSHRLDLNTLHYQLHKELYCKLKGEESGTLDTDFGINPETLKTNYLDLYENVYAEMIYTNRFDKNSDLSTTHLGQIKMTRDMKVKAEENFPTTQTRFHFRKIFGWN